MEPLPLLRFPFFPALTSISFFKQSLNMLPLNHRAFLSPAEIPVIRHAARIHSAPQSEITRVKSVSEGKTRNDRDQVMWGVPGELHLNRDLRWELLLTVQCGKETSPHVWVRHAEAQFILFATRCFCSLFPLARGRSVFYFTPKTSSRVLVNNSIPSR